MTVGEKRKTRQQLVDELAESQAQYRLTIDSMVDALHVVDRDLRIVLINRKFLDWHDELGLARDVVGKELFNVYPFLTSAVHNEYEKVFETASPLTTEELTRIGVRQISTETRKIPVVEGGRVTKVMTIIRDISERKRVEAALRESEEKFRTLADQSPSMIWINLKGRIVYANKKCEEIMGYTREEYYSPDFDFLSLIAPDSIEKVSEGYARYLEGHLIAPYEYALITKDGRRIEAIIAHELIEYDGETALLGVVTDITDRKRAEEALRASEEKYRSFVENFHGIAYRGGLDGTPIFFEGDVERITGYTEEDLLKGSPKWEEIVYQEDRVEVTRNFGPEAFLSKSAVLEKEYRIVRKDGQILWVHQSIRPVRDASGTPIFVQGAIYDITDRKLAEEGRERERTAFRIIADAAVHGRDTQDVCERILVGLVETLGFEFGTLRLYDAGQRILKLAAATGLSQDVIREKIHDQPIDSPDYVAAYVARTKTAIFAPNARESVLLRGYEKRLVEMNVASLVSWPLVARDGSTLGVIHLFASKAREIPEGDRDFFETVVDMMAVVLERKQDQP
jgi:PAS domain S-box-containing protein